MIEETVMNSIEEYTSIPAFMEVPEKPSKVYAIVERAGGSINETISTSLIVVQSYAQDLYTAASNCDLITDALLYQMIEKPDVVSVTLNSKYNFPDMTKGKPRYQAIFEITHY